jgi:hypothetical protein
MKKLIIAAVLAATTLAATADPRDYQHRRFEPRYRNDPSWIFPALIGGAIIYGITQQAKEPPPVYVEPPPQITRSPYYEEDREVYEERIIYKENCRCYVKVLVRIR